MLKATARRRQQARRLCEKLQLWGLTAEGQQCQICSCSHLHCNIGSSIAATSTGLPTQQERAFHVGANRLPVTVQALEWNLIVRSSFAKASKKKQDSKVSLSVEGFDSSAASEQMSKAIEYMEQELASVRTGRASAGLLDHIKVQVYGQNMPMKAAANISVRDAQTIVVTAFDPSTVSALDKAISSSALGLNPRAEGQELVVPVPRPTKDTLTAMAKLIGQSGESAKVKLRQIRKSAVSEAKQLPSEDDQKRAEKQVQQLTDEYVANVEKLCSAKQRELQVL